MTDLTPDVTVTINGVDMSDIIVAMDWQPRPNAAVIAPRAYQLLARMALRARDPELLEVIDTDTIAFARAYLAKRARRRQRMARKRRRGWA